MSNIDYHTRYLPVSKEEHQASMRKFWIYKVLKWLTIIALGIFLYRQFFYNPIPNVKLRNSNTIKTIPLNDDTRIISTDTDSTISSTSDSLQQDYVANKIETEKIPLESDGDTNSFPKTITINKTASITNNKVVNLEPVNSTSIEKPSVPEKVEKIITDIDTTTSKEVTNIPSNSQADNMQFVETSTVKEANDLVEISNPKIENEDTIRERGEYSKSITKPKTVNRTTDNKILDFEPVKSTSTEKLSMPEKITQVDKIIAIIEENKSKKITIIPSKTQTDDSLPMQTTKVTENNNSEEISNTKKQGLERLFKDSELESLYEMTF